MNSFPEINISWKNILKEEFDKDYIKSLFQFLMDDRKKNIIYPKYQDIFRAYDCVEFEDIKVVIIGQDPYHGPNQAHGLSFSVNDNERFPPSLVNIFKELSNDIGCEKPRSGNLSRWAEQGVFLINSVLTVREGLAGSHKDKGWEEFTDATIKAISDILINVVFILWGRPAQKKENLIDTSKHLILKAPHPSPLSSYRGFFGSKPFSKTNDYLKSHGKESISWCL